MWVLQSLNFSSIDKYTANLFIAACTVVVHGAALKDVTSEALKRLLKDDRVLVIEEVRSISGFKGRKQ